MNRITLLALSVSAGHPAGYCLTACVYQQGDRRPSSQEEYGPLTRAELTQVVDALLHRYRPGWEYAPLIEQPPLWADPTDLDHS